MHLLKNVKEEVRKLDEKCDVIYKNQVELAKSETRLDEQFAVLTRLTISTLNKILSNEENLRLVTYDEVNTLFSKWNQFKSRPDFRKHMRDWFMGGDVDALPPIEQADGFYPGVTEFGGAHEEGSSGSAEADSINGPDGDSKDEEAAVPGVQDSHTPGHSGEAGVPQL